jgi:hypothetical protein
MRTARTSPKCGVSLYPLPFPNADAGLTGPPSVQLIAPETVAAGRIAAAPSGRLQAIPRDRVCQLPFTNRMPTALPVRVGRSVFLNAERAPIAG